MDETRRLAQFVADFRLEHCPPEVIHQAKRCVVETVGCALAGARTPLARAALDVLQTMGEGGCSSVVGSGRRAAPDRAAFVNGVAANALDYDGGVVLQGHYGGTVVFSALAVAELVDATGREFLEAIIAAYEVTTRIGVATRPSLEHRRLVAGYGPHQGFAAVVTAGRLLKLDVERLVHAFGIYGAFAPVPSAMQWNWRNRPLTWTKDMVAWPSVSGINAVMLAKSGFLGPRTIMEGERGFWRMAGSDQFNPEALLDGLGTRFDIMRLYFKAYPTCRWNQAPIDALRQILTRREWNDADVMEVEVGVARALLDQHFDDYGPHNLVDAQFSLPYALAVILQGEAAGPHWYEPTLFDSPAVARTMRKVKLRFDEEIEELFFAKRLVAAKVKVKGADGSEENARVDHPHGDAENPLTDKELDDKFRALADVSLPRKQADPLLQKMRELERLPKAAEIGTLALG